jgi:glycine/D-amino acid oxidase-like deaminating enzyme
LRPFRRSGFRVAAEVRRDKTVVHDYGHGGGGVSLSWGTAELALELAPPSMRQVAVLGCGAVGLATARLLQQRGCEVTIYARDLPPATTSNVAGALWLPTTVCDDGRATPQFTAQYERATELAFRAFERLAAEPRYGVRWLDGWALSDTPEPGPEWQSPAIARLLPAEPIPSGAHPFPGVPHVFRFPALHIDTGPYLAALLEDFRAAGGRLVQRMLVHIDEALVLPEPLVMNCTGLGAGTLCADDEVLPIKGQLALLRPQPEIDYVTLGPGPGLMYTMPRRDGVVLGGTCEPGVNALDVDEAQAEDLLARHQRLFGELFDACAAGS